MSWKCDKCRKLYTYHHDGDPKNPRLKQMMNGKFICDKCNGTRINKKSTITIGKHQYLADNILGVFL